MNHYERYVYEPELITAILDICPIVHIGFQDKNNAYVLPMNYGYKAADDKLLIFIHSAKEGYKIRLIERNPIVCCTFSAWINHPDKPYKGHVHNFRSVMAFGKIRLLDLQTEPELCKEAIQTILKMNHRTGCKNPKGIQGINLYMIECDWSDVSGKTETPVRKPEDVPFLDVYGMPEDKEHYEKDDLLKNRENRIRNRRYLGYLDEEDHRSK